MSRPNHVTKAGRGGSARQFDRPIVAKLRRLCLALPETSERASWGHPNFRAGKRTFVAGISFRRRTVAANG
jgi:hypothetical protein